MQGSPIGAEQRMQEIELRCERALGPLPQADLHESLSSGLHKRFKEPDFKAIAAVMQNQMYSATFGEDDKKDSNAFDMTMLESIMPNVEGMNDNPEMQMLMQGISSPADFKSFNPQSANPATFDAQVPSDLQRVLPKTKSQAQPENRMINELLPGAYSDKVLSADMPVQGRISSHYGDREHPVNGHHHFHTGVDIAAPMGTAIKAPWDGEIVYVGKMNGFGPNTVVMAHPGTAQADGRIVYSVFGHNSSVNVHKGDKVAKGDEFAAVGSEGRSTGPHLHWETRLGEPGLSAKELFKPQIAMTVNPLKFV